MNRSLTQTTAKLTVGVTAVVVGVWGVGAYLYSRQLYERLLVATRATAVAQAEMIEAALEHEMQNDDRHLIESLVQRFSGEPSVERVFILNREGKLRYGTGPVGDKEFSTDSPTCLACHAHPADHRARSRAIETQGGEILRTVTPIYNRPVCHECHDAEDRVNGVLIVDIASGKMREGINTDLAWMSVGNATLTLLLLAAIAFLIRSALWRRLVRFESAARRIAEGDLAHRVPVQGADTVSWLAEEFNAMADAMSELVHEVHLQRRRLETVINSIDDGILVLDDEHRVIAANDAFLRRVGLARERLVGRPCHDVSSKLCQGGDCISERCFSEGRQQVRICERGLEVSGSRFEEVHASPVRDPEGNVTHVVEVWRDISERRAAEARLAESHRLASLGLLASGFSHELNTPLATVLMCVEGILRDAQEHEGETSEGWRDVEASARIARDQLIRCRGVTQHFLRLARGQRGAEHAVNLGAAVEAVVRLIGPTAREHGVSVSSAPVTGTIHVRGNEADLQQVLLNLMLNAVQACQGRSPADVHLEVVEDDPVRVVIRDTGCGISAADRTRIFEPFFSMRQGGTGLGLFLALNAVRSWGGDIQVQSELDRGTVFTLFLSRPATSLPPMHDEHPAAPAPRG